MMKHILLIILLLTTTLFAKSEDLDKVSVRLLWLHQFEFAGFYTALEKGYYKDVGLDVEIKEYEFGVNITDEVLSGESDFGLESSSLILDKMQGKDVHLLMAIYQHSPFVLMAKKRDDLQSIEDLRGKKIMFTPNQVGNATLNAMLRINNLYHNDYVSIAHTFDTKDLIEDRVDAMSTYVSNEPFHLKQKGVEYTIFDPADYGFAFYTDIVFSSKEFVQQNPKIVEKFHQATLRGWEYSFENIDETIDLIFNKYNTQEKSKEHLLYEALELKNRAYIDGVEFGKFKHEIIAQIAQTYQLLNLSTSTVNFDDLVYEKAIHQDPILDYSFIFKIGFGVFLLILGLYFWNRKLSSLNKTIEIKSQKISTLLDNAKQGFLTFDTDFKIDSEYSKECNKLLGKEIENKDITDILFQDREKKESFKNTVLCALGEKKEMAQNSIFSLLPSLIILNQRALQLEYKMIDKTKLMMMITNISKQKKLEKRVKKEQEVLQMIVAVVSQSDTFYDIKNDFLHFVNNFESMIDRFKTPEQNVTIFYRIIHTFKGIFAQLYMHKSVARLHQIESELSKLQKSQNITTDALLKILSEFSLDAVLDDDLELIGEILGEEFVGAQRFVKINYGDIKSLQEKISKLLSNAEYQNPECQEIISKIQKLSSHKLIALLKPYEKFVDQLAKRLNKNVHPLLIRGDEELSVSEVYKPFFKSLVHLFRNCIDHGVEEEETRIVKQKDEFATIECNFFKKNSNLILIISDDGAGIDTQKIKEKLDAKGIDTQNMDEDALMNAIFDDNFSTKESVNDISGRGVGLGAIKSELQNLGASVKVTSKKDFGTKFEFTIPM